MDDSDPDTIVTDNSRLFSLVQLSNCVDMLEHLRLHPTAHKWTVCCACDSSVEAGKAAKADTADEDCRFLGFRGLVFSVPLSITDTRSSEVGSSDPELVAPSDPEDFMAFCVNHGRLIGFTFPNLAKDSHLREGSFSVGDGGGQTGSNIGRFVSGKSWNVPRQDYSDEILYLKVQLAKFLRPILELSRAELAKDPNMSSLLKLDDNFRVTCDHCLVTLLSIGKVCSACGMELCLSCFRLLESLCVTRNQHCCCPSHVVKSESRIKEAEAVILNGRPKDLLECAGSSQHGCTYFLTSTRLDDEEVHIALSSMDDVDAISSQAMSPLSISSGSPPPDDEPGESSSKHSSNSNLGNFRTPRRLSYTDCTELVFSGIIKDRKPVVIHGVPYDRKLWCPTYFKETYGDWSCKLVRCNTSPGEDESIIESNISTFFSMFGDAQHPLRRKGPIKLKDFPPESDFSVEFPDLHRDFYEHVPAKSYTRYDGLLNLHSFFPRGSVVPDLGPKLYVAFKSSLTGRTQGSTRLHLDISCAFNNMPWAVDPGTGQEGKAVWHIFRPEDSDGLRQFLYEKFHDQQASAGDPILSQQFYLRGSLLKELKKTKGVIPFEIWQAPGETVYIPAGCAHQVCNLADCIKVAADFVPAPNLPVCQELVQEFQKVNKGKEFGGDAWLKDVLQFERMLWYSWKTLDLMTRITKERANCT